MANTMTPNTMKSTSMTSSNSSNILSSYDGVPKVLGNTMLSSSRSCSSSILQPSVNKTVDLSAFDDLLTKPSNTKTPMNSMNTKPNFQQSNNMVQMQPNYGQSAFRQPMIRHATKQMTTSSMSQQNNSISQGMQPVRQSYTPDTSSFDIFN